MSSEKNQLTEEIGLSIEKRFNITPLAARIYAFLSLSTYEGLTFEEIREAMQASKSSISVNIKVLNQLGYITYQTKSGDRKRYFKISKYFQIQTLKLHLESLENEMEIVSKINAYNRKYHPEKFSQENSLGEIAQNHILEIQNMIQKTIQKISNLKKQEDNSSF